MNLRSLNPAEDLPLCDICGATMISMSTETPHKTAGFTIKVSFACGSLWSANQKSSFNRSEGVVPNGLYTPYDKPSTFLEEIPCSHAAKMARKLRGELSRKNSE